MSETFIEILEPETPEVVSASDSSQVEIEVNNPVAVKQVSAVDFLEISPFGPISLNGGAGGGISQETLDAHIEAETPHTAYDADLPRLDLIFENGLI